MSTIRIACYTNVFYKYHFHILEIMDLKMTLQKSCFQSVHFISIISRFPKVFSLHQKKMCVYILACHVSRVRAHTTYTQCVSTYILSCITLSDKECQSACMICHGLYIFYILSVYVALVAVSVHMHTTLFKLECICIVYRLSL